MSVAEIPAGEVDQLGVEGEGELLEELRRAADRQQRVDGGDDAAEPTLQRHGHLSSASNR